MFRKSQPQLLPLVAAVTAALFAQAAQARMPTEGWLTIAGADAAAPSDTPIAYASADARSPAQSGSTGTQASLDQWTGQLEDPSASAAESPSIAYAYTIEGSPETELTLSGDAELRRAGTVIKGETIVYTQETGEVKVTGDAEVSRLGVQLNAPEVSYQLDEPRGVYLYSTFSASPV